VVKDNWIKIKKGNRTNPLRSVKPSFYRQLSHDYAQNPNSLQTPSLSHDQ
jgi:hypothetical protein